MSDFEKMLRGMFSSIWDCEIDHPLWQDTVGEIMTAVIQAHEKCMSEFCKDAISRQAAIDALDKRFDSIPMEQTVEVLQLRRDLRELPPAQLKPERRTDEAK